MAYIGNTPGVSSQRYVQRETVSGSAKSLFVVSSGYSLGYVDVFVNGVQLDESDFTATDGVSVTLAVAAQVGDIVRIIAWLPRGLSDGYLKSEADARYLQLTGGALTGALTSSGSFSTSSANGYNVQLSGGNAYRMYATTNDLVFRSVTAGSDVMTLTYGGNVGIGTISPAQKLDISGTGAQIALRSTDTTAARFRGYVNGAESGVIGFLNGGGQYFETAGSERMRLDAVGNLGLGVTPSAWSSVALEIGYGGNALWGLAVNDFRMSTNLARIAGGNQYKANGAAAMYNQASGGHYWYTAPSGTAGNAISFTQAMTLDASGNLGVGATSPNSYARVTLEKTGADAALALNKTGVGYTAYLATDGNDIWLASSYGATGKKFFVSTTAPDNAARIDSSGNLLVGTTSLNAGERLSVVNSGAGKNTAFFHFNSVDDRAILTMKHAGSSGGTSRTHIRFENDVGTQVGNITVSGSATSYNTSSDYRLKHDIAPMTGALAKVAQLKPVTYKWNADNSDGEGFIAHELQAVVPQAVTGEKDAVDADGKPQYQGIDTSFLVATLTAAIQELKAIVDAQAERIAVLENA